MSKRNKPIPLRICGIYVVNDVADLPGTSDDDSITTILLMSK